MEIYEIFQFLRVFLAIAIPFGTIYLLLGAVNWDRKRNLLVTSFFVFLVWIVSSAVAAFFLVGLIDLVLGIESRIPFFTLFFLGLLTVNTCAVAAVLWWRKSKEENLSILGEDSLENLRSSNDRIWRTSLLVSCLTLLVTIGFWTAQKDIETRLSGKRNGTTFAEHD